METTGRLEPRGTPLPRGARRSPRHKLLAAVPFRKQAPAPTQAALIPAKLSYWGNNQYGDCVSAEEAFKCAADNPEDFVPDDTVILWAQQHGFLNGANLTDVMDAMIQAGFVVGANEYRDGHYLGVDYSNENVLQAAIASGVVKIAIDADALPPGAGNDSGWHATGGRPGQYSNTDHCVALCGFGPAKWLFDQMKVALPSALRPDQTGYLLFTWSTIGFVDHSWIMSTTTEAWVRNPSTIIVGPEPQPQPPNPNPQPAPTPTPSPGPGWWQLLWPLIVRYGPQILAFIISLLKHSQEALERATREGEKGGGKG